MRKFHHQRPNIIIILLALVSVAALFSAADARFDASFLVTSDDPCFRYGACVDIKLACNMATPLKYMCSNRRWLFVLRLKTTHS